MKGENTGAGIRKIPMRKEKNEIYNARAVGERIRSLRDSKGITQEYLAEKFGSKIETIRNYETGKSC